MKGQRFIVKDFAREEELKTNSKALLALKKNGFSIPQFTVSKSQNFMQFEYFKGISIYDLSHSYGRLRVALVNEINDKITKLMKTPTGVPDAAISEPNIILDISNGRLFIVDAH